MASLDFHFHIYSFCWLLYANTLGRCKEYNSKDHFSVTEPVKISLRTPYLLLIQYHLSFLILIRLLIFSLLTVLALQGRIISPHFNRFAVMNSITCINDLLESVSEGGIGNGAFPHLWNG